MDSPEAAKRKPLRLRDYNYDSAGYYFITICTEGKRHLLGHIVGAGVPDGPQMSLSPAGKIVDAQIKEMASHYDNIDVPKYVLMPNHIHLIIVVTGHGTSRTPSPTNSTIPAFISTLKRFTNKKHGIPLWQRG
ncbi:MAG: hypothetical protein MJ067_05565, partial [Oscillospiraceae bacterium]|nr:hypothetical protein [Oscillospiraceae bacterium]